MNAAAIVNPSTSIVVEYLQEDLYEVSSGNENVTKLEMTCVRYKQGQKLSIRT